MSEEQDEGKFERYLLFLWHGFNPVGGTDDLHGSYPTVAETCDVIAKAMKEAGDDAEDWRYAIIDTQERRVVRL